MRYQHSQPGHLVRIVLAVAALGCLGLLAVVHNQETQLILGLTGGLLLVAGILFHQLTVSVDDAFLRLRYGIGLIRFRFAIASMEKVEVVQSRWWEGWGIRLTPHGWLFNISGLDAVQIWQSHGKQIRIGSDDAEGLCRALQKAIEKRKHGSG